MTFDDLATGVSLARDHGRGEWLAEVAAVSPGDRVLDIGCGPGNALVAATERGATAIGLDPSPTMLWLAARRAPGSMLLAAGVDAIPLPSGAVNVAWASGSFHHWPDIPAGLAEVHRVLEPGGRLLIVERETHGHGIGSGHAVTGVRADQLVDELAAAGFADARVDPSRFANRELFIVQARHDRSTRSVVSSARKTDPGAPDSVA